MVRVSVITVCFNSAETIAQSIRSVSFQSYRHIEHVIIDGGSTDGTLAVIEKARLRPGLVVSEADDGIYDAMNKGFSKSSGDIVCFLNSDDHYADENVLSVVGSIFEDQSCDFVFGNITMESPDGRVRRHWRPDPSCAHSVKNSQIPHPSLFFRRSALELLDKPFDCSMRIAADLKQQLLLVDQLGCRGVYLDRDVVRMRTGGASTAGFRAYLTGWLESAQAYNQVMGSGGVFYLIRKLSSKLGHVRVWGGQGY